MKTPLLAWLAAASVAFAANTGTTKKPSGPTPPGGNKTAATEKAEKEQKPKKGAKAEAPTAAPEAAADPVSLVVQTVDATTQMALDAAKASQAEADKLAAIGTGKVVGSASNAKLAEAAVVTGAAVAKELSKPKKESDEAQPETKKPESKKPEKPEPKSEKKPTPEKPKKAAGA
jgi:hypothetical protein